VREKGREGGGERERARVRERAYLYWYRIAAMIDDRSDMPAIPTKELSTIYKL
jgi:hypothetical protein